MKAFRLLCKDFGYKEVIEYLENRTSKEEMIEKIKRGTRRYAKRQTTWFKKTSNVVWLEGDNKTIYNVQHIIDSI